MSRRPSEKESEGVSPSASKTTLNPLSNRQSSSADRTKTDAEVSRPTSASGDNSSDRGDTGSHNSGFPPRAFDSGMLATIAVLAAAAPSMPTTPSSPATRGLQDHTIPTQEHAKPNAGARGAGANASSEENDAAKMGADVRIRSKTIVEQSSLTDVTSPHGSTTSMMSATLTVTAPRPAQLSAQADAKGWLKIPLGQAASFRATNSTSQSAAGPVAKSSAPQHEKASADGKTQALASKKAGEQASATRAVAERHISSSVDTVKELSSVATIKLKAVDSREVSPSIGSSSTVKDAAANGLKIAAQQTAAEEVGPQPSQNGKSDEPRADSTAPSSSSSSSESKPNKAAAAASSSTGRWTPAEHEAFLAGLKVHGREWKKVAVLIPTRTSAQIRSHAQKYFAKLEKEQRAAAALSSHQMQQQQQLGAYAAQQALGAGGSMAVHVPQHYGQGGIVPMPTNLSSSVLARARQIMENPEAVQSEVERTLMALRRRYRELQMRVEASRSRDRGVGSAVAGDVVQDDADDGRRSAGGERGQGSDDPRRPPPQPPVGPATAALERETATLRVAAEARQRQMRLQEQNGSIDRAEVDGAAVARRSSVAPEHNDDEEAASVSASLASMSPHREFGCEELIALSVLGRSLSSSREDLASVARDDAAGAAHEAVSCGKRDRPMIAARDPSNGALDSKTDASAGCEIDQAAAPPAKKRRSSSSSEG